LKKITIPYFSKELKYTTPLFGAAAIYAGVSGYMVWGILLVVMGIIILTTNYVTEIRLNERECKDYIFFLGFELNRDARNFNEAIKIVITKEKHTLKVVSRVQSHQTNYADYTGTLLFDNAEPLDLLTDLDKNNLLTGLKPFAEFLQVGVEDLTTHEPYFVDLEKVH